MFLSSFRKEFQQNHGDELDKLSGIYDASHLRDNQIAVAFKSNKFNISMNAYSFQLLINFLQEQKAILFIKIINQYVRIRRTYFLDHNF